VGLKGSKSIKGELRRFPLRLRRGEGKEEERSSTAIGCDGQSIDALFNLSISRSGRRERHRGKEGTLSFEKYFLKRKAASEKRD